jgi:glycosyltransferase involved in cell wall biosynthesis
MATVALDATYIFDTNPTGIAIYSRRLIESLAELDSPHRFLVSYKLSRIGRRREFLLPAGPRFSLSLFQKPLTFWQPWRTDIFHSLAQRPPAFRFRHEVVTIHDVFPITGPDYSTPAFQKKFSRLLREALDRAERVLVLSDYTARQVVRHCGVERERIRGIPGGVDRPVAALTPEAAARERERRVGPGNEMLLAVGVVDNRKNVLGSLRALQCFRSATTWWSRAATDTVQGVFTTSSGGNGWIAGSTAWAMSRAARCWRCTSQRRPCCFRRWRRVLVSRCWRP